MSWPNAPLSVNLVLFTICAVCIWLAGSALARNADVIADRQHLGKAFMGLVFLATATELPEIAMGQTEILSLVFGILVTGIFAVGIFVRRKRSVLGWGIDSACVLAVNAGSLVALYFAH